jgi:hypothetical protein
MLCYYLINNEILIIEQDLECQEPAKGLFRPFGPN